MEVGIVDYGCGNIQSVKNAIEYLGHSPLIIDSNNDHVVVPPRLILPGVGAFGHAMGNLKERGLIDFLNRYKLEQENRILGICLGMQLMCLHSEESPGVDGLGWFPFSVKRLNTDKLKIPHVGWNYADFDDNPLSELQAKSGDYYFVHSFGVSIDNSKEQIGKTNYGHDFCSAICSENISAYQFHPEKSQSLGLDLIARFIGKDHE